MSLINLHDAKSYLNVSINEDDIQVQMLIDSVESQALRFMNRDKFGSLRPSDDGFVDEVENMPADVRLGILFLLRSAYDCETPKDIQEFMDVSERYFMPYRICVGV